MDFVRSYFFTNATLTSCPLFFIKIRFSCKIKKLERIFYIEWMELQLLGFRNLQEKLGKSLCDRKPCQSCLWFSTEKLHTYKYILKVLNIFLGCQINSKVAWIVQECPAFFVSAVLLFEAWASTNTSTKILVGMFMLHYFQRYWHIRAASDYCASK